MVPVVCPSLFFDVMSPPVFETSQIGFFCYLLLFWQCNFRKHQFSISVVVSLFLWTTKVFVHDMYIIKILCE